MEHKALTQIQVGIQFDQQIHWVGKIGYLSTQKMCVLEWDREFLKNPLPLSPIIQPTVHGMHHAKHSSFGGLHPLFNDSLPDGFGLRVMDHLLMRHLNKGHVQQITPLERLGWIGDTGIGALVYAPEIATERGQEAILADIAHLAAESEKAHVGEIAQLAKSTMVAGGSAQGARPKFWALLNSKGTSAIVGRVPVIPEGYTGYLIKLAPDKYQKDEPLVEHTCLTIAKKADFPSAHSRLLDFGKGLWGCAVERFDRTKKGRFHTQTLSALLGHDFRSLSLDWTDVYKVLEHLKCTNQAQRLFSQACFHVALSLKDDHGKNISFQMDAQGQWSMAPGYDLMPCAGPGGWHSMSVDGQAQAPGYEDLMRLGKKIHLEELWCKEQIEKSRSLAEDFIVQLKEQPVSSGTVKQMRSWIQDAQKRTASSVKVSVRNKRKG